MNQVSEISEFVAEVRTAYNLFALGAQVVSMRAEIRSGRRVLSSAFGRGVIL